MTEAGKVTARGGRRPALPLVASAAAFAGFLALALLVRHGWSLLVHADVRFDDDVNATVAAHRWLVTAGSFVSTVLGPTVLRVGALVAALVLLLRGRRRSALFLAIAVEATVLLSALPKEIVDRARPMVAVPVAHASGASYPSSHALTSFVAAGSVLVLCPAAHRVISVLLILAAVVVGCSRVVLGVHYPSDVVGGWLLGAAWLLVLVALMRPAGAESGRDGTER